MENNRDKTAYIQKLNSDFIAFSELEACFKNKKEQIAISIINAVTNDDSLSFYRFLLNKLETLVSENQEIETLTITTSNITKMYDDMILCSQMESEYKVKKEHTMVELLKNTMTNDELEKYKTLIKSLEDKNKLVF